ncbi:AI-2E family transporter [Rubrobacter aplysinae]|uniref:AI-2E family transporter n=1 Tax=Rubrobacter aplysinae TaxID=909625 RepID=UPI00069DF614|nr:AI-2E family transporter [Rubrobacter aplysinae]
MKNRTVYLAVALAFALAVFSYFVYEIRTIVLVLLLTMLFSIIISGPVDYLAHRGLPRGLGILVVLGVLAGVFWLGGVAVAPVVERQARELVQNFPALLSQAEGFANRVQNFFGVDLGGFLQPQRLSETISGALSGDTFNVVANIGGSIANGLSLALVALIGTIYLVIRPAPLVNGFVSFFPAERRPRVREILTKLYGTVQRWFLGQLTTMVLIGVLSAIAFSIIGVPFAVLLGVFGGLVAFVPFIGPTIAVIPAILLALSESPVQAIWVLVAYLAIQAVESNVIQPIVMSQAVELHPAVVVFGLLIMGTLFGFVGLLLAVPLVAAIQVLTRELWVKRMDRIGTDPAPPAPRAKPRHPTKRFSRAWRALKGLFRS